jgi:hypothetical protein
MRRFSSGASVILFLCFASGGAALTQSFRAYWNQRSSDELSPQHIAGLPRQHAERKIGSPKQGDDRRLTMRNRLLVTTAMAALIGCTTLAVAQEPSKEAPGKATVAPQGGAQHPIGAPSGAAPGGAMAHPQPNGEMKPGGAAQNLPQQPKTAPQQQSQGQEHPGQGASENHGVSQSEERNNPTTQRGAQEERGTQEQRGAQSNEPNKATGTQQPAGQTQQNAQGAAPNKASGGANVKLSEQQRTQIKDVIVKDRNVARVDRVNFSISVGVAVPRTVHVAVLPPEVVTIVPEYSGFDYIIVGDQLLIIDPNTMEIVYILPA